MAFVPLVALSHFEFQFSLPPLEPVVGMHDPFFTETPVKDYRRPTRKRGRRDDKTIKKFPSAFYFAHEPLCGKQYPKQISRPQGGLINKPDKKPVKKRARAEDSDQEDSEDSDDNMDEVKSGDVEDMTPIPSGRDALVEGGRAAAARPINANLDADDEILVRMKLLGRPDKEIAEYLTNLGRVKYNMKTIGSRWKRLRIVLADALDEELDKKIARWSEDEDAFLLQAYDLADQAVTRLKKEAEDSRWTIVAQKLKTLKKNALYSVRACRERYKALQNGTAILPAEGSDSLEQQTTQPNEREATVDRMEVDVAPSRSVANKGTRPRSGLLLVANEDKTLNDGSSDISDAEGDLAQTNANEHLSTLITSGIDLSAITNLPFKAQVASASIGRKAPDLPEDLKAVEEMNRDELREELRMRGLCSDGLRSKMADTLSAARAGNTDLKHSPKNAMNPNCIRPAKPVKKSAARRLSAILPSDAEGAGDEDRDYEEGPMQKRAKKSGSSKAAAKEQPAPGPTMNTQSSQRLILSDEILDLIFLPRTKTNRQLVYQKEVEDGCRMFLCNVPSSFSSDTVRTILSAFPLKAVHTLRTPGSLVVDCADVETAVGVTSAIDKLALQDQVIVVENAQVLAQKYLAAQDSRPSTKALSTKAPSIQASTPGVSSVSDALKPEMLIKKDSKSPRKDVCRIVVKNVPASVDALQLQQIFGQLSSCERTEPGVWLMGFFDAITAIHCYTERGGAHVHGQLLELEWYQPEVSNVSNHRPTKREADMYDDVS